MTTERLAECRRRLRWHEAHGGARLAAQLAASHLVTALGPVDVLGVLKPFLADREADGRRFVPTDGEVGYGRRRDWRVGFGRRVVEACLVLVDGDERIAEEGDPLLPRVVGAGGQLTLLDVEQSRLTSAITPNKLARAALKAVQSQLRMPVCHRPVTGGGSPYGLILRSRDRRSFPFIEVFVCPLPSRSCAL